MDTQTCSYTADSFSILQEAINEPSNICSRQANINIFQTEYNLDQEYKLGYWEKGSNCHCTHQDQPKWSNLLIRTPVDCLHKESRQDTHTASTVSDITVTLSVIALAVSSAQPGWRMPAEISCQYLTDCLALAACGPALWIHCELMNTNIIHSICHRAAHSVCENAKHMIRLHCVNGRNLKCNFPRQLLRLNTVKMLIWLWLTNVG